MYEDSKPKRKSSFIAWYYLATPLFFLLDFLFGHSFRVSAIEDMPTLQHVYYSVSFLVGIIFYRNEILSALFGIFESLLNILLLIWSILGPYYESIHAAAEGKPIESPLGLNHLVNFAIAGTVLLFCFYTNPLINKSRNLHENLR